MITGRENSALVPLISDPTIFAITRQFLARRQAAAGPAPTDCFFKGPPKNQNYENENGTQHNGPPLGDGASCADTRGHPDTD
jgi:hypothetical protein